MSYVLFREACTTIVDHTGKPKDSKYYATVAAVKSAKTRAEKAGATGLAYAEASEFYDNIEQQVERVNIMTGKTYMERQNTPRCASPSTELYWSM